MIPCAARSITASFNTRAWFLASVSALHALAVGGGSGINVLADAGGTNERNSLMSGCRSRISASLRLVVTRFSTPSGKPACFQSSLMRMADCGTKLATFSTMQFPVTMQMGAIHPCGSMAGKFHGADAGEDTERLAKLDSIVAGRDVHQRLALHHLRCAAGKLDNLDRLEHVAGCFVPLLAVFLRAEIGKFIQMLIEQLLHFEEHLGALGYRSISPCWKSLAAA